MLLQVSSWPIYVFDVLCSCCATVCLVWFLGAGDCRSCAAGRGTTGHGGRGGREGREGRDVEARDVRDVRDVTVVRSMKKRVSTQTLGSRDLKDALSELKNKCCVLDGLF